MPAVIAFDSGQLEGICQVLGDTDKSLTGSAIDQLLRVSQFPDPHPSITKWNRLFEALLSSRERERCGSSVVKFIQAACAPSRYAGQKAKFETRREELNFILVLCGYELGHDGQIRVVSKATTLSNLPRRRTLLLELAMLVYSPCTSSVILSPHTVLRAPTRQLPTRI
jgi:hypothetical protein